MIPAVILAGGQSRRMGVGDKCLMPLGDTTIIEHVIAALTPQVSSILINSNSDSEKFARYNLPVWADTVPDYCGPLAGLLTGMRWAEDMLPKPVYILTVAADMPFLPQGLVGKLTASIEAQNSDAAVVRCGEQTHPTVGLWRVDLACRLRNELMENDLRKMHGWLGLLKVSYVNYTGENGAFFNINSQQDLSVAIGMITRPPALVF